MPIDWMIFSRAKKFGRKCAHTESRTNRSHIIHPETKTWWLEDCFPFGMLVFQGLSSISEAPDTVALSSCALTMNGHIESYPIEVSCHASPTGNLPFPCSSFGCLSTLKYLIGIQKCGAWQHNKQTASSKNHAWDNSICFQELVSKQTLFTSWLLSSPNLWGDWNFCHFQVGKKHEIHQPGQLGKSKNGLSLL